MYKKAKQLIKKIIPTAIFKLLVNKFHWLEAFTANIRYGFPARGLKIIGVTGTSGKSTTTAMLSHILNHSGRKAAHFTTTNAYWGGSERQNKTSLTTETANVLYGRIKKVKQTQDEYLVIESSAHALVQHRLAFLAYKGAVFTNLSHDHLDYFGSMEVYAKAKQKLFAMTAKNDGYGVFKANDPYTELMSAPLVEEKVTTYGVKVGAVQATSIIQKDGVATFTVSVRGKEEKVALSLLGEYNVENALASIACALQEGVSLGVAAQAMSEFTGVKGRMERFEAPNGAQIVVDFAHTPDALELVLSDLRKTTKRKLIAVYGGYGDRDKTIRAPFGRISSKYADAIILTEDTVGSESVESINEDIKQGIIDFKGSLEEIEAREKAIKRALEVSSRGDTVALLGKGHEREIKRYPRDKPWDEIQAVKDACDALR